MKHLPTVKDIEVKEGNSKRKLEGMSIEATSFSLNRVDKWKKQKINHELDSLMESSEVGFDLEDVLLTKIYW